MEETLQDLLLKNSENFFQGENFELTTTSNGTTALHLALLALGIGSGDEVIVPNFSYIAVINAVIYCGATPVIADVSKEDWNINPSDIRRCISEKTKALIAVDNYGRLNNFYNIRSVVNDKFPIIQDAAESFPLSFTSPNGFGDLITLSFYGNKVFTSAEGGAVAGKSVLIDKIRSMKNQSLGTKGTFSHIDVGYNYRITNIHAAIFNAQWSRRLEIMNERKRVFSDYKLFFEKYFENIQSNLDSNPWLATVLLPNHSKQVPVVREVLHAQGIETRPGFTLFSDQNFLSKYITARPTPISMDISSRTLSLPTYPQMSNSDVNRVCEALLKALA
jgi:perosamine synthetase